MRKILTRRPPKEHSIMKKTRVAQSAYTILRLTLAVALCLAGLGFAVTASGSWEGLSIARFVGLQNQALSQATWQLKHRKGGGASKSAISNGQDASAGPAPSANAATQPGTGDQPTVTSQTNSLGQIVYSIKPSAFDISLPLTELANSLPELPIEERPELELPPWRT